MPPIHERRKIVYRVRPLLFLLIFIFSLLVPNAASARNNDVPFYNGTPDTELTSRQLQIPGKLLRPGKGYTPQEVRIYIIQLTYIIQHCIMVHLILVIIMKT